MVRVDPERTLLFGILALQIGLIKQAALATALEEWARAKDRDLAEILVEQGALEVGGKVLVETLVHKHVELHGDNPETVWPCCRPVLRRARPWPGSATRSSTGP